MLNFFSFISNKIGLPEDQFRVVFCWLAAIPLGFWFKDFQGSKLQRHVVSLLLGLVFSLICVQEWILITLFASIVVYGMMKYMGRRSDWPSFIFLFTLLTICNIYRYLYDFYGWKLDGSISLMSLLCKMTYVTFYYCDGRLKEMPSLLEYYSYLFFFPSAFCGPVFDFQTYKDYIDKKGSYKDKYSSVKPALYQMTLGLVLLGLLCYLEPMYNPNNYFQEYYLSLNYIQKLLYMCFICTILRFRYFGGWKFSQAGMDATGISYNGKDSNGQPVFDRIVTFSYKFEFALDPKTKTEYWNSSVQQWLKNAFFVRFQSYKFSPKKSLMLVFAISALWHGVHPVYYLGFAYWAALNELGKRFYAERERFSKVPGILMNFILFVVIIISFNQIGLIINMIDMHRVMRYYQDLGFVPLFAPFLLLFAFILTGFGINKKGKNKHNKTMKGDHTTNRQDENQNINNNHQQS